MFRERLKELRKENGYTQENLAIKLNLERSAIGKYESLKANTMPSIEVLYKLSDLFNVSIDYLLGRTDERNNQNKSPIISNEELDKDIIEIIPFLKKIQKADPAYFDSVYKTLKAYSAQLETKDISETKK